MDSTEKKISPLKKIQIIISADTGGETNNLLTGPVSTEFIFGVGAQGLTVFECELEGKQIGSEGVVYIDRSKDTESSGCELPLKLNLPVHADKFYLRYKIVNILEATPKEIVKATAEGVRCGGASDCDCGGH